MKRGSLTLGTVLWLFLGAALPAAAEMGFRGWGIRAGVGEDPDQGVVGLHTNLGEFARAVRFQPSFELGAGDDATIVSLNVPAHYRFSVSSQYTPYAGGGIVVSYVDFDPPHRMSRGDNEVEISALLVGGIEWPLASGNDVFLELGLPTGDIHQAKFIVGWMKRRR